MIEPMTRTSNESFGGTRTLPANEKRWRSVQTRDRGADGAFVYAVRSTGIYCRPSCPSRRPRREQVEFFPLPEAAERKGFRACLRCRPCLARLRDPRTAAVAKVCREIEAQIDAANAQFDSRNERASTGARVSHRNGNLTATVCRCAADAPAEVQIAKRRRRDYRTVRRRIWIEQPIVRTRSGAIGDDTRYLQARRRRDEDPLHDCKFAAGTIAGGGDRARDQRVVSGERRRVAGKLVAKRISACGDPSRQEWLGRMGRENTGARARARTESGSADRRAGDCVSTAGVGRIAQDSLRCDTNVQPGGTRDWQTAGRSSGGPGMRNESCLRGGALPSRGARRRQYGRLSLGAGAQTGGAGARVRRAT